MSPSPSATAAAPSPPMMMSPVASDPEPQRDELRRLGNLTAEAIDDAMKEPESVEPQTRQPENGPLFQPCGTHGGGGGNPDNALTQPDPGIVIPTSESPAQATYSYAVNVNVNMSGMTQTIQSQSGNGHPDQGSEDEGPLQQPLGIYFPMTFKMYRPRRVQPRAPPRRPDNKNQRVITEHFQKKKPVATPTRNTQAKKNITIPDFFRSNSLSTQPATSSSASEMFQP